MRLLFLGLLLVCLGTAPAFAEKRVALIVANGGYQEASLANPSIDAKLVQSPLEKLGFDVTVAADVDFEAFDRVVSEFAEKAQGADVALFYYAGHGFAVSDRGAMRNVLMAVDANVMSTSDRVLRSKGIPLDDIIEQIASQAKTTLVFIDACRNDPRVSRGQGGRGRGAVPIEEPIGESVFVGLSTRAGDTATDGAPGIGSPFARAFAANIASADLRVDDAFTRMRLAVEAETGRDQRPDVGRDDLTEPLVLNRAGTAVAAVEPQADPCRDAGAHWYAASQQDDDALIEEHLKLFPTCAFAGVARMRLAEPADGGEPGTAAPEVVGPEAVGPAGDASILQCDLLAGWGKMGQRRVEFEAIDSERATTACRAANAAHPQDSRVMVMLGRAVEKGGNYSEALSLYEKAAALGELNGMTSAGWMFHNGLGVQPDMAKAIAWYEKAAAAGSPAGMQNLAALYDAGTGVERDSLRAARYIASALKQGFQPSADQMKTNTSYWSAEFRRALQAELKQAGVYDGDIDGSFGPATFKAIDALLAAHPPT